MSSLISGLSTLKRGQLGSLTLDKSVLFALPQVLADAWFSDQSNVEKVAVVLSSSTGRQTRRVIFKISEPTPSATLQFSQKQDQILKFLKLF